MLVQPFSFSQLSISVDFDNFSTKKQLWPFEIFVFKHLSMKFGEVLFFVDIEVDEETGEVDIPLHLIQGIYRLNLLPKCFVFANILEIIKKIEIVFETAIVKILFILFIQRNFVEISQEHYYFLLDYRWELL